MQNEFLREQIVKDKNEEEINDDIIRSIVASKMELNNAHINMRYADPELIDYYSYKIKAAKSKLDYLIRIAKDKKISVDMVKALDIDLNEDRVG